MISIEPAPMLEDKEKWFAFYLVVVEIFKFFNSVNVN